MNAGKSDSRSHSQEDTEGLQPDAVACGLESHRHHHRVGCIHHHHHHGSHGHVAIPTNMNRAFAVGVALNLGFVVIEAIAGWFAHSLALLADAGHNLSDVLGLVLAWGAYVLNSAKPTERRTYGWKSTSILAALFNAQILMIAIGAIIWEALHRLVAPETTNGWMVMIVAATGVVINSITAILFMRGQQSDLNVRGAYLHMAADAAVSLGVVVTGTLIAWTGAEWLDPLTSLMIALVILIGTWSLLRESLDLALHAVPKHLELNAIRKLLHALPGVVAVHDLHVWAMSTTDFALTAHLVREPAVDDDELIIAANQQLHDQFGIAHVTLQIERSAAAEACRIAPDDVV